MKPQVSNMGTFSTKPFINPRHAQTNDYRLPLHCEHVSCMLQGELQGDVTECRQLILAQVFIIACRDLALRMHHAPGTHSRRSNPFRSLLGRA